MTLKCGCALLVILIAFMSIKANCATYYIDSLAGNDATHDGTRADHPWKTLGRLETSIIKPGDAVLLKRGSIWRETLSIGFSGTTDKPVVFDAYGDGPMPVISGADEVTGLRETDRSGIWTAAFNPEPRQVFIGDKRAQRMQSAEEVNAERTWHWADGKLTLFSRELPVVEASVRDHCANVEGHDVTFRNITFARSALVNIMHAAYHGLTLQHCLISGAFVDGLRSGDEGAHDRGLIENCEVTDCGGSGLIFAGRMDGWILRNNHIHHCCRLHEKQVGAHRAPPESGGACWYEWSAGIKYWAGGKVEGYLGSLLIENNLVEECRPQFDAGEQPHKRSCGIWIDESLKPRARTVIRNNIVRNNSSKGIFIEKADDCDVMNNICYDNAEIKWTANIMVESNFRIPCRNNRIFNNTCVGGHWTMALNSYQGMGLENNEFRGNIAVGGKGSNLYVARDAINDGVCSSNNRFIGNCFGREKKLFVIWNKPISTYADWEQAYGGPTHSIMWEPDFVNPGDNDYRLKPEFPSVGATVQHEEQ